MNHSPEVTIDARGLLCPQPVLLLARAANDHPGALIEVWADDPAAQTDIPAWAAMRDAVVEVSRDHGDHRVYVVRAAGKADGSANAPGSRSK